MNEPTCKHCNTPMQPDGIALIPNLSGIPDFDDGCVVTVSPDGTARQVECFKCHQCGYSVTIGKKITTFGSVCSGIEAASVAWHPLGWKASWLSEISKFSSELLAHYYPDVPNLGDMTTIVDLVKKGSVDAPDVFVGGTPCFTAGHMVITQRGYVPIEEIVVGDMVVTHKGRLRRVVRIGSKIARVGRLSGVGLGEKISCTPDHPFRSVEWRMQNTKRGNKYEGVEHIGDPSWTAAKDMPSSQWCALTAVSVDAPVMPDGIDADELLYIAGFYLGDGFIRRWADANKKAVVFGVNDEKVDRFKARVTQSVSVLRERTGPRIVLGNTAIADWLIENFGEYSHAKTLPAWVLAHPQRAALMDGYRDTDGHCTANGWRAISVSRALAYGMRDLAQTLGMVASVAFTKVEPTKTIEGRKVNQRDYWTVTAFNGETSRKSRIRHGMLLRTVSAFEEVGDETVFNIEVDEDHSYVLDGVIVHNCQAFSFAGLRNSLDDARGNLTLEFARIADAIDDKRMDSGREPAVIVWENVPGVLSTKDNAFGCFLGLLAGSGCELQPTGKRWSNAGCVYGKKRTVAWRILDAQYFGVAQRRRRVFVVASAGSIDPCEVLFERGGVSGDIAQSEGSWKDIAGTFTACAYRGGAGGKPDGAAGGHFQPVLNGMTVFREGGFADYVGDEVGTLRSSGGACGNGSETLVVAPFDLQQITSKHNGSTVKVGAPCPTMAANSKLHAVAIRGNVIGRKDENGGNGLGCDENISPTLTSTDVHAVAFHSNSSFIPRGVDFTPTLGAKNANAMAVGNKYQVRRLTPVECERLQGFPDNFTSVPFGKRMASDAQRYFAIGNSMAVPVMRWIGERIMNKLDEKKW